MEIFFMTPSVKRRIFLRSLTFVALSPLAISCETFPQHAISASKKFRLLRKSIQPIDDDYLAVDGWIVSKKQLTHCDL